MEEDDGMAQCKCNLIIDSCCDLPFDEVDKEGVEVLSFPYIMSDGEHVDDLYCSRTAHDFFEDMRKGEQPSTAQIAVTVFTCPTTIRCAWRLRCCNWRIAL